MGPPSGVTALTGSFRSSVFCSEDWPPSGRRPVAASPSAAFESDKPLSNFRNTSRSAPRRRCARSSSPAQTSEGRRSAALNCCMGTKRESMENDRIVIAIPITNRGCSTGATSLLSQPRVSAGAFRAHGASNRIRVISSGGGSTSAARSMNATAAAESRASFGARRTGFQMPLHFGLTGRRERAIHVIADQFFQFCAVHTTSFCFRNRRANSARPRLILRSSPCLRGSPTLRQSPGTPFPAGRARITASRKSGESFCKVACRISLASRPASKPGPAAPRQSRRLLPASAAALRSNRSHAPDECDDNDRSKGYASPALARCDKRAFGATEGLDRLENPQEHILRQVLRFLRTVRKTETQTVHLPRVLADKVFPGGFVAVQAPGNERLVQAIDQISASGNISTGLASAPLECSLQIAPKLVSRLPWLSSSTTRNEAFS